MIAHIHILDEIGPESLGLISHQKIHRLLSGFQNAREIIVHLNSPGGDVFEGIGIYNALLQHPAKITVKITGLAASAASLIAMAGDVIEIAENAMLMIHNAYSIILGDRHALRHHAGILEKVDRSLAEIYAQRSGFLSVAEAARLMDRETWFTSKEAHRNGLVDRVVNASTLAAVPKGRFKNAPAHLVSDAPSQRTPLDLIELLERGEKVLLDIGAPRGVNRSLDSIESQTAEELGLAV